MLKKIRIMWRLRRAERKDLPESATRIKTYLIGHRKDGSPIFVDRSEFVRIQHGQLGWTLLQLLGNDR